MSEVRIDKYLWSIRVFKTRNEATEACKGGKVKVNGNNAKPSHIVKPDDLLEIRKGIISLTYKVLVPIEKRQGAAAVSAYAENLTPESEYEKLRSPRETFFFKRDPGTGRPTKKDRRQIDAVLEEFNPEDFMFYDDSEDE